MFLAWVFTVQNNMIKPKNKKQIIIYVLQFFLYPYDNGSQTDTNCPLPAIVARDYNKAKHAITKFLLAANLDRVRPAACDGHRRVLALRSWNFSET